MPQCQRGSAVYTVVSLVDVALMEPRLRRPLPQIYPEPDTEKTIMGSVVYCIHHKDGCKWSDELRKLKVSLAGRRRRDAATPRRREQPKSGDAKYRLPPAGAVTALLDASAEQSPISFGGRVTPPYVP